MATFSINKFNGEPLFDINLNNNRILNSNKLHNQDLFPFFFFFRFIRNYFLNLTFSLFYVTFTLCQFFCSGLKGRKKLTSGKFLSTKPDKKCNIKLNLNLSRSCRWRAFRPFSHIVLYLVICGCHTVFRTGYKNDDNCDYWCFLRKLICFWINNFKSN